jgi:hypothetical protein
MENHVLLRSSLALAAALAAATPALAQNAARSTTSKLFVGLAANGATVRAKDLDSKTETGGGLSGQLGYGFTPHFAIVADFAGSSMSPSEGDRYGMGHFDLSARYSFANSRSAFVPYLEAGFGGRALSQSDVTMDDGQGGTATGDLMVSGTAFTFGAGMHYFVAPAWALAANFKASTGQFDTVKFQDVSVSGQGMDAFTTRLSLGFTWFPMSK